MALARDICYIGYGRQIEDTGGFLRTFGSPSDFHAAVGEHLGYSDWTVVDQEAIDAFAALTGDSHWLHVDRERSAAGPFGSTIAHGYLTLSLTNGFLSKLLYVENSPFGVNYGDDRVRFPTPVVPGSALRMGSQIVSVRDVPRGVRVVTRNTVEMADARKPACVTDHVNVFYFE